MIVDPWEKWNPKQNWQRATFDQAQEDVGIKTKIANKRVYSEWSKTSVTTDNNPGQTFGQNLTA